MRVKSAPRRSGYCGAALVPEKQLELLSYSRSEQSLTSEALRYSTIIRLPADATLYRSDFYDDIVWISRMWKSTNVHGEYSCSIIINTDRCPTQTGTVCHSPNR